MAIRVFLRIKFGVPVPTKETNSLLKLLSAFVHLGIYLVLFAIPLTGLAAFLTLYTGYDYVKKGIGHATD